ncbi:MAG: putative metal-binding motif-containing protein, partial [Deltaproteobacteria bacterium]|nr:putative metal-binding motif-containing protein [Deltaproteobacteria bacterium]
MPAFLLTLLIASGCVRISADDAFDRYDPDGDGVPWPQDCAPLDDSASEVETWYADSDGDGVGDPAVPIEACGQPEGYVDNDDDCDDSRGDVYPGAPDGCDGIDNDCDTAVDEDAGGPRTTWYADDDADTYGDPDETLAACVQPEGYVANDDDCDDGASAVHPTATEVCNGVDDDCNGYLDDEDPFVVAPTWYADFDTDGYGATFFTTSACEEPTGFVDNADDCNDIDAAIYPGAPETDCDDPTDYNCDGSVGLSDLDADGFAACEDCNDGVTAINPDADEVCDGIDNDCDGAVDADAVDADLFHADADGDGYGDEAVPVVACLTPSGFVSDDTDCDDTEAAVNPGVVEVCDPLDVDEDCSGASDAEAPGATGLITWYGDDDGDGYGEDTDTFEACEPVGGFVAEGGDCDDDDEDTYPDAPELCDGIDNDCDLVADDGTPVTWYADIDGDLHGDPNDTTQNCFRPDGYVFDASDCDDTRMDIHPDAPEMCDGDDNDCDTEVDEDDAVDAGTWYFDWDGDGFGVASVFVVVCDQPADHVADPGDCDDANPDRHPGEPEVCDPANVDENCNGKADDGDPTVSNQTAWHWDLDDDNYGDETRTTWACDQPPLHLLDGTDCNDSSSSVHPGATEIPDDQIDQDCSGVDAVTCFVDWDQDTYGTDTGTTTVAADGSCDTGDQESDDDTDCDDTDPGAYPGAVEIPLDGVDQDCDGSDAGTCPFDGDGDGYGPLTETVASADEDCDDLDEAWTNDDCDDEDAFRNPGEEEIADDQIDQDCNGFDTVTCILDADMDTFGTDPGTTTLAPDGSCDTSDGESEDETDCDDGDPDSYPLAPEVPDDGIDQDCNEYDTVTCIVDGDTDGFGTIAGDTILADDGTCDRLQGESD